MNYLSTTELRTKSVDLLASILAGEEVNLVHRSKIVATIKPVTEESKNLVMADADRLIKLAKKLDLPKITDIEMEKRYRRTMAEKYGKTLS